VLNCWICWICRFVSIRRAEGRPHLPASPGFYPYPSEKFDAAALIYVHFPDHVRQEYHRKISDKIKPGGSLIPEAFSKNNLAYRQANPSVGGPDQLSLLFDIAEIKTDFPDFLWNIAEETEIFLDEGIFHKGKANVVRLFGKKNDLI
jgi:hypothetical protein